MDRTLEGERSSRSAAQERGYSWTSGRKDLGSFTYLQFLEAITITQGEGGRGCGTRQEDGAVLRGALMQSVSWSEGTPHTRPRRRAKEEGNPGTREVYVPEGTRGLFKGHSDTELQQNPGVTHAVWGGLLPVLPAPLAPPPWCVSPRGCKPAGASKAQLTVLGSLLRTC